MCVIQHVGIILGENCSSLKPFSIEITLKRYHKVQKLVSYVDLLTVLCTYNFYRPTVVITDF